MDSPAAASHRVSKLGFAEGGAIIHFVEELSSGLKQFVCSLHLLVPGKIAKTVPLVSDCIVIEKGLQSYALNVKDLAKELEHMDHLPRQAQALSYLSREKSRTHGLFLFGQVPGRPAE